MTGIKAKILKASNALHIGSVYFSMGLLVSMTIIIIINVFMRFVLNSGLRWAEEVSKILMVWFTFIGLAVGVKQGLHISIHILPKNLPQWMDKSLIFLKEIITVLIAVVFFFYGIKLVGYSSRSVLPATQWPGYMLYLILPVSSILILSEALLDIFHIEDNAGKMDSFFFKGDSK